MIAQAIYCRDDQGWLVIDAVSGELSRDPVFSPIGVENGFWLVVKPGEAKRFWSYDPISQGYVAAFRKVEQPRIGYSHAILSVDGKKCTWIVATIRWKVPEALAKCNAMEFSWVETPLTAEEDGTDQPAPAPESKPNGKENPKPESEGCSK